ncbi:MAG TPA: adenylate/guanylate cyclase domain-containing protein [Gaiellaceae bacterium]|nr:adenylate/guanylate cyclase domain-containing protein [Gaiellaceae bacterium]
MTIGAHRKVVTVLFCDVVGSTALGESVDPEALQGLLARYFERMKAIVESHGGTVEKFIGDAVMAVFGVPVAHEDDALRACRAAVEMREALPGLGVEGRIGVNTGEVLAGTEERLATGDAVNVAARLEQAAQPGEVLIGAETLALVDSTVETGQERRLELKGKSAPVTAHPLLAVREAAERSHTSRFVGRERELQQLADGWARALAGSRCELLTVVGDPGVGKSRLVAEALAQIDARVVRGRCLTYGEGITYWPVVEVVKQLGTLPGDEAAATAIRSLLGKEDAVSSTDEIAWAFRRLLEEQSPLVVCFDDIQWGEEKFLELIESTALLSTGAPLLLLCMARPELLDRRPSWPAGLRLEPLPEQQAGELVGDAASDTVRQQIVRASGGNPLFVTEMLALAAEGGEVEVPATLRALLAARLDGLDEPERRVLERGAIEGEVFHRGTVQALAPEEIEVTSLLAALVRRDLIRPERPQFPGDDGFRFRHLLIRDAAYDALPKAARAELHRRFADWLEAKRQLVELDEVAGYHLEQAARYLDELGRFDPDIALAAGDRLAAAGRRAASREDSAGAGLLTRALGLTRRVRLDVNLELDLAQALGGEEGAVVAERAAERAEAAGDAAGEALARTLVVFHRGDPEDPSPPDRLEALALRALPLLEEAEDDAGLAHAWYVLGFGVANARARYDDWARAIEESLRHSRLAGLPSPNSGYLWVALQHGSRPVEDALARLEAHEALSPWWHLSRAWLLAMLGRFEEALPLAEVADAHFRERGGSWACDWVMAEIAALADDHETARRRYAAVCDWLEANDSDGFLATYAPALGRELCMLGRYDEAEEAAQRGREAAAEQDLGARALWRQVLALVHASRNEHGDAERLAREAVELLELTDGLQTQGDARYDLATVLEAAGRRDEAIAAWEAALERYERKGIVPLARRVRDRLTTLQPA